ncbi:MAG: GNAT family N-acetyltransferase [Chloroflexota bacterium]|nr:GNAT family N-acetyltransferase [Chloroflexota bacterium]
MTTKTKQGPIARLALADAPAIPGLSFRRYRGEVDLPEMVRVANACHDADGVDEVVTVEGMTVDYANLTNSDPYRDVLLAEVDGRLVAYARVEWEDENNGGRTYTSFGFVDPTWRRRGLGRAMLLENERRLRQIAADHLHDKPRWLGSFGADRDESNTRLLLSEGYVVVRHFYDMVRPSLDDIEDFALPEGLEVRPVSREGFRAVFDADGEAFRDHWGGIDASEAAFRRWIGSPTFDPSLYIVAWDGDQIAGGVLNIIDPVENAERGHQRGLLDSVFTRRPWRRRGLARALIGRSFHLLRERGMTSAALGVDAANPNEALALYRSSGFNVHRSYAAYRKPFDAAVGPEWVGLSE